MSLSVVMLPTNYSLGTFVARPAHISRALSQNFGLSYSAAGQDGAACTDLFS